MGIYEIGQLIGLAVIVAAPVAGFSFRLGWLAAEYLVNLVKRP